MGRKNEAFRLAVTHCATVTLAVHEMNADAIIFITAVDASKRMTLLVENICYAQIY